MEKKMILSIKNEVWHNFKEKFSAYETRALITTSHFKGCIKESSMMGHLCWP
jgi:hypothetical protein